MSLETQGNQAFLAGYPGILLGYPGILPEKFEKQNKFGHGEVRVQRYGRIPRSAANNLGEIPKKLGAPNRLF